MTTEAWFFLSAAVAFVMLGWLASWRGFRVVVVVARPTAMLCLAGSALWLLGVDRTSQGLFAAGLAASGVGDLLLAMPRHYFAAGSGWFLVARILYGVGFVAMGVDPGRVVLVLVVAGFTLLTVGRILMGQVRRLRPGLVVGTATYMAVAAVSVALGVGTGNPTAGLGVVVLAASDVLLGWNRFVRALAGGHGSIHVVAHAAQLVIVMSLLRG